MELKDKIMLFLTAPWFISLIICLVVWLTLPVKIEKYNLRLTGKEKREIFQTAFFDLDRDGNSERIHLYKDFIGRTSIIIYSKDKLLDQWNFDKEFDGDMTFRNGFIVEDIDHDGITEIIIVTLKDGEILLHCFNPFNNVFAFRDKKIGSYTLSNGRRNTHVLFTENFDADNNGFSEIYFAFQSNFSIWPRGMNVYDYANDTVIKSPVTCNEMEPPMGTWDIDQDGVNEFYFSSQSVGNCSPGDPYTDHYSWLMVFTSGMQFKFEPVITGIYPAVFRVQKCEFDNVRYLAGLYLYKGDKKSSCYIALYNKAGEVYKKTEIDIIDGSESATILPQTNREIISILNNDGTVFNYNEDLEVVSRLNIGPIQPRQEYVLIDANSDGEMEYLLFSKTGDKLMLAASDFSSITEIKSEELISLHNYSVKYNHGAPTELFIQSEDFNYFFLYRKNPYFPFRFMLLPGIYMAVLGCVSLLSRLQKIRMEQKYRAEKQLLEFQLKSIKNQLDPHFTLNLIASIGDLFDKKDSKTSKYVFSKYSTLLRQSVLNADQYSVTLDDELEFVENYLNLEKFRLDNRFDFEILCYGINRHVVVPKMLIHSFVENAVRHGIQCLTKKGRIDISAQMENTTCIVKICDNGIGRERSSQTTELNTGKGLSIIDQIIKNYNELKKTEIIYRINDLKDGEGNSLGTEVIIRIPA